MPPSISVEEARERIGLVFERGMKVPLQYEESIEIRHDFVGYLFLGLPAGIRIQPTEITDQQLEEAGLGPYVEHLCPGLKAC